MSNDVAIAVFSPQDIAARHRRQAGRSGRALEIRAKARGRTLLTLDTRTADKAEPLYRSMGYEVAGIIPDYCCDPSDPTVLDATTIMYKQL